MVRAQITSARALGYLFYAYWVTSFFFVSGCRGKIGLGALSSAPMVPAVLLGGLGGMPIPPGWPGIGES